MTNNMNTKEQILYLLKKHQRMTVNQLAKELDITGMAIRRHLNSLEKEHLIQISTMRQSMGRPVQVFALTEKGHQLFPRNYFSLAMSFLTDIEALAGSDMISRLFKKRQARMADSYLQRMKANSFTERVKELAAIQNEHGYMVEFEEIAPHTFKFVEYNCPIYDVAHKYRQACNCEIALFKKVLQTESVEQVFCMANGEDVCQYIVKQEKQA